MSSDNSGALRARMRRFGVCAGVVVAMTTVVACGGDSNDTAATSTPPATETAAATDSAPASDAQGYTQPNPVLTEAKPVERKGPRGEEGVLPTEVKEITADEKKQIEAKNVRVGISWHSLQLEYSRQVQKGIKGTLEAVGVKPENIFESEASFDPEKQAKNIEDLFTRDLDLLVIHPSDDKAISVSIRKANQLKVPVVVLSSAAQSGEYESLITSDNFQGGFLGAQQLCKLIGNKGEVGLIELTFHLWHADERTSGFRTGLKDTCPDVKIGPVGQANGQEDGQAAAENMLTAHPNLDGMWTIYDVPGVGASNAAKALGHKVAITTHDVGSEQTALEIKSGELPLKGSVAHQAILQGEVAARISARVLLGEEVPKLVWIPVIEVNTDNVAKVYESMFGKSLG